MGSVFALGIAIIAISYEFNWRVAFWIVALVVLIGSVARTVLREIPEFVGAKRQEKKILQALIMIILKQRR